LRGCSARARRRCTKTALALFIKADSVDEVGSARAELARASAAIGDWQGAYEQHVQFQTAQDALLQQLDQRYAA
jgi:hypothetical protein